jgi:hypothetical protein
MRSLRALLNAMYRRTDRIGPDEAERMITGDRQGPLRHLLDAARAPATEEELAGEKAMVAAFAAHRGRAARTRRKRRPASVRTAVVTAAAGLALLSLGGTALAARSGNLPREAQQHAHRLFSALGVPAPRTGQVSSPTPRPTPSIAVLSWCDDWRGGAGKSPMSSENRRKLRDAAGGEDRIGRYCAAIRSQAASAPPARPPSGAPSAGPSAPGASDGVRPSRPGSPAPSGSTTRPAPIGGPKTGPVPPPSAGRPGAPGPPTDRGK